ncbi:MAG: putative methyltransferase [Frankiales bacterium]|nr:putative methyltransferase [Frankiales bacterium]
MGTQQKLVEWAKSAYVTGAHVVGSALVRVNVIGAEPPTRDSKLKHWAYSLVLVHDTKGLSSLDVPWWTYKAIDKVEDWLAARPHPIRVFEYGSGVSTLWLAKRADEVHSVEHHVGFAESMQSSLEAAGVDLLVIAATTSTDPRVPSAKPGYADSDFRDYVAAIDGVPGEFDLIAIDGRARQQCLEAAVPRLKRDGLIVFDNSLRSRYRAAIAASGMIEDRTRGLTPTLPYPEQTSLLTFPS